MQKAMPFDVLSCSPDLSTLQCYAGKPHQSPPSVSVTMWPDLQSASTEASTYRGGQKVVHPRTQATARKRSGRWLLGSFLSK